MPLRPAAMPRLELGEFSRSLLQTGVSPRHVRRTVLELAEHYDDLVESALGEGMRLEAAEDRALHDLGDLDDIGQALQSQPQLRTWSLRYPYLALVLYPLTCIALLPAVPVRAGVAHAGYLGRWAMCLFLSGIVTATMFLAMQLSIALT